MRRYKTYINGEWFEGTSGIVLRSVDPSNNKELGEIVQNSKEDVEYAIESASRSFYTVSYTHLTLPTNREV